MTSITSVAATAAASIPSKLPAPTTPDSDPAKTSAPTVGSSSAANVPSAIAALALRGDADGDADGH